MVVATCVSVEDADRSNESQCAVARLRIDQETPADVRSETSWTLQSQETETTSNRSQLPIAEIGSNAKHTRPDPILFAKLVDSRTPKQTTVYADSTRASGTHTLKRNQARLDDFRLGGLQPARFNQRFMAHLGGALTVAAKVKIICVD